MRLSSTEKKALAHALEDVGGNAFLYGSRANDRERGGDIDLLVFSRTPAPYRLSKEIAVRFRMECDEKIDVLVVNPDDIPEKTRPFVEHIQKTAKPL